MRSKRLSVTVRVFLACLSATILLVTAQNRFSGMGAAGEPISPISAFKPAIFMATPVPTLDLKVEGMEFPDSALVGEVFCYTARIENIGDMPGFGPAIVLALPPGLSLDKASLPGVSGSSVGTPSSDYAIGFQGPLPNDPLQQQPPLTGNYNYYTIPAPIGSLFPGMPGIDLKICVKVDVDIAPDVPVQVYHTPYYQFGDSALGGNPIKGDRAGSDLTPVVVQLSKKILAPTSNKKPPLPTNEVVTGCTAYTFQLNANIAKDITLIDLDFKDILPTELIFVPGSIDVKGLTDPNKILGINDQTNSGGGGSFSVLINDDTGVAGSAPDVTVEFKAYVKNFLSKDSCGTSVITNRASLDALIGGSTPIKTQTVSLPVEVEHVAIQKSAAGPRQNPLIVHPGDIVNYRLDFQVSQDITANNVMVEDLLPNGLQYNAGSATISCSGGVPNGSITPGIEIGKYDGKTRIVFNLGKASGCASCSIFYSATVSQSYTHSLAGNPVRAADLLINSAVIKYDLEGGVSGCVEDTVGAVLVNPVTIKKSIKNPKDEYIPGDLVTFVLRMDIPSGDTRDIHFFDFLPLPIFKVTGSHPFNVKCNSNINACPSMFVSRDQNQNSMGFEFSDVTSSGNPAPYIEVEFSVQVTTDPFVDDLYLTNLFQAFTTNTKGEVQSQLTGVVLNVRAPKLKITKGAYAIDNPAAVIAPAPSTTPVNGNVTGADGSDKVTFHLTVKNEGGAPAYSPTIVDTLPPQMMYVSAANVSGPTPIFNVSGQTITVSYSPFTVIPPGQSLVVSITAMLIPGLTDCPTIVNKANVRWRNVFDPEVIGPPLPPFYPDVTDTATVSTARPKVTKKIVGTGMAHTDGNNVVIGETVTYQVEIEFPEGVTGGVKVTDTLPPGMAVQALVPVGGQATIVATSLSAAIQLMNGGSLTSAPLAAPGNQISFNFGDVKNNDANNAVPEKIIFTYSAVVLNKANNLNGTTLTNNVMVATAGCGSSAASAPPLTVVEPKLKVVKEALNAQGQPLTTADAGDLVTFAITVSHDAASTADAFDIILSDLIPAGHAYQSGSLMVMGGNHPPNVLTAPTPPGNNQWSAQWNTFPLGKTSVIKFTTKIADNVSPCRGLNNTALVKWTSLPGLPRIYPISQLNPNSCERGYDGCGELNNYATGGTALLAAPKPSAQKTLKSTSAAHTLGSQVTIGEVMTYEIRICLPEGTIPASVLTDLLPPGVSAVSATIIQSNSILGLPATLPVTQGSGVTQSFNFGTLTLPGDNDPNNNCFIIELNAVVLDIPANSGMPNMQTALNNIAKYEIPGCEAVQSQARTLVVEPKLTIGKEFMPATAAAGDTVQIKLTVANVGTSDAFEVIVEDLLNSALGGAVAVTTPTGYNFSIIGQTVSYQTGPGVSIKPGETVTLVFRVKVNNCGQFPNVAKVIQATTLPGTVAGERDEPDIASSSVTLTVNGNCPCVDPPRFSNMVGWWPLDESQDATVINDIAGSNPGIPKKPNAASIIQVPGKVQGAMQFNNGYIEVYDSNSLDIGVNGLTIDAWIKPYNFGPIGGPGQVIVDKVDYAAKTGYAFLINPYGYLHLIIGDGVQLGLVQSAIKLTPSNSWIHLAVTVERKQNGTPVKFYVDGIMVSDNSAYPAVYGDIGNNRNLIIGGGIEYLLDEIEIFNVALTESEIKGIVDADSAGKCKCPRRDLPPGTIFNTGVNSNGGSLAVGLSDSHYSVMLPNGTMVPPVAVKPNTAWVTSPKAQWIANASGDQPGGTYKYSINFNLTDCEPNTATIKGKYAADNSAYILVNNNQDQLFPTLASNGFKNLTEFKITTGLQPGQNTLTFVVNNNSGVSPTGLLVEFTEISIRCCCPEIVVKPDTLNNGLVGTPYPSTTFTATGETGSHSYAVSGTLPPGMDLSASGQLTGTPTATGTYSFIVTATDANGCKGSRAYKLEIGCPVITVSTSGALTAEVAKPYSLAVSAAGGCGQYAYSISSGQLPTGLKIDTATGKITGTPTTLGEYTFEVKATDRCGCSGVVSITIKVECPTVDLKARKQLFNTGVDDDNKLLKANLLDGHYTVTDDVDQVSLPTTINPPGGGATLPNAGWISLKQWKIGTYRFKLKLNMAGCEGGSAIITGNYAIGGKSAYIQVNNDPTQYFPHNSATSLKSFSLTGLKPGSNTITFVIESGDFRPALLVEFIRATARCCGCPERLTFTPEMLPKGKWKTPYPTTTIKATGGVEPYTYAITSGKLPAGMTLSSNGVLSGTPTQWGVFVFIVTATNQLGCTKPRQYVLQIRARFFDWVTDVPPTSFPTIIGGAGDQSPGWSGTSLDQQTKKLSLAINMEALGDEHALNFSLGFDPMLLLNPVVSLGKDAAVATLTPNYSQVGQGKIGISIVLPGSQVFAEGPRQVAIVQFDFANANLGALTSPAFTDQPVPPGIVNASGNLLEAEFSSKPFLLAPAVTSVSAANYAGPLVSSEQILAAFGTNLATTTIVATEQPLPTSLGGTTVTIRDSSGAEKMAQLFFVSPNQINYLLPANLAPGQTIVTVRNGNGDVSGGIIEVDKIAPGLFTVDATGAGVASSYALTVKGDNTYFESPTSAFNAALNKFISVPVSLGVDEDRVFLVLFGTGIRYRSSEAQVTASVGGLELPVLYAGPQGGFVGLDQINVEFPRALAGLGEVDVVLTVDGVVTNVVRVNIQ